MNHQAKKPSWLWFLVVGLILVAGIAAAVGIFVGGISSAANSLQRMIVPATQTMTFDEPGRYGIYHEHRSVLKGRTFRQWPGQIDFEATVTRLSDGAQIPVEGSTINTTYTLGKRQGRGIFQFDIEQAGQYEIVVGADDEAVVAIGRSIVGTILFAILGPMGVCFASFVLGLVMAIVTIVRMVRYRRAVRESGAAVAGSGTFGQPPGSF